MFIAKKVLHLTARGLKFFSLETENGCLSAEKECNMIAIFFPTCVTPDNILGENILRANHVQKTPYLSNLRHLL